MKTHMHWMAAALLALTASLAVVACGGDDDDTNGGNPDARVIVDFDSGVIDAGTVDVASGADADCITDPQTSAEIMNACTAATVTKIDKHPTLPLLLPNGTLPPLP
jgi:hypothetical protein